MDKYTLVVFGDQSASVSSHLSSLLLDVPRSATQSKFIREAGRSIQRQLHQLSHARRSRLPNFSNVHQMARAYEEAAGECHPAITGALVCITQLLQLFRHFETRPVARDRGCVSTLGLCTGSLAAVAFAASDSTEDLSRLAVPTVLIAFQVGIYAAETSSCLYEQRRRMQSWSVVIPMFTEQEAMTVLSDFEADDDSSRNQSCYVSAVCPSSVTISGTPVALEALLPKLVARTPNTIPWKIPIFAAFHAAHLYTSLDTSSLLISSGVDLSFLATCSLVRDFISSATGEKVQASSALDLFDTAIKDILQLPLRKDRVIERYAALLDQNGSIQASITLVEPFPGQQQLVDRIQALTRASVRKTCLYPEASSSGQREERGDDSQPLAIVGMSCRLPGDVSCAEELWDVLCKQSDMHQIIPPDRFDVSSHVDSTGKAKNTSYTPYGCFIDRPGEFDPRFFKMSPKEASQTCPMQRLALVTAYEALEHAGFVPDRTPSSASHRVGTFFGQTSDDYRDTNSSQDIGTHFITGGIRAFGPGRINHVLKFSGPSYCVDTACSSSLAAIQLACTAIWNDECDTAIAGGLSVLTSPDLFSGLSRGQFLSKTGSCKTFDDSADGYCRADGIGTIVIKRLTDALQDRDNVLATILAAATNHSAHAISITHPHAPTQLSLYRQVLDRAGVDPRSVGYVEMHGTGTQPGDKCEMKSVTQCFSPSGLPRAIDNPLYVGSVKGSLGHGEAASGVTSLIKAMLILQKSQIPPHVGIQKRLNTAFPDLESLNVHIPRALTPLIAPVGLKKTVLVNNFSAAGGNTALLLQEPPPPPLPAISRRPSRTVYAVAVSGHTSTALSNNLDRMITHLSRNCDIPLQDLSYTTTSRRRHHRERVTVVANSTRQVMDCLRHRRARLPCNQLQPVRAKKVVFVFTGQGSAYCHLAQQLYDTSAGFRRDIDDFHRLAESHGFPSFLGMIDGTVTHMDDLSPAQSQLGMLSVQVALARMWASLGIQAAAVLGHSLGEYAALTVAGVLSVSDAILLVGKRAQLLESRCTKDTHAMLAVTGSHSPLQLTLDTDINIACSNSPKETVFAGTKNDIDQLQSYLERNSVRSTRLSLSYAFHSAQVDPILDGLQDVASGACLGQPDMSIISATYGRTLLATERVDARYFAKHSRDTVKFYHALQDARERGVVDENTVFLEIGPHPVCCGMIGATLGEQAATLPTLRRNEDAWVTVTTSLAVLHDARVDIDWAEYQRDMDNASRLVDLPPYAFDNDNYWIPYENEWTLRKGEAAPSQGQTSTLNRDSTPNRISASVHRLLREDRSGASPTFEFETDLSYCAVHAVGSGHRVNGSCLCPSSLYADIALTIAQYLNPNLAGDIRDMQVTQPLLVDPNPEREEKTLRVTAYLQQDKQSATLKFFSCIGQRQALTQHAICYIEFGDSAKWSQRWAHDLHLVDDRIGTLQRDIPSVQVNSIHKAVAYRLFADLVDYAPDFRKMTRVWLDSSKLEAVAIVSQQESESDKGFCFSPYRLDALLHLSGFIMNAAQTIEQTGAVYISHGWRSLRLSTSLLHDEECTVYVKMISLDKTMVSGNVYMIQRGGIVGVCEGVQFQQVRRAVLDLLLPPPRGDLMEKQHRVVEPCPSVTKQNTSMELKQTRPSMLPGPIPSPALDTGLTASFFNVISEETGVQHHSLTFESDLNDLGIDSLMSLAIAGRLKEQCGLDIDHAHILHCQTLRHLWDSFSLSLSDDDSADGVGVGAASSVSGESAETGSSGAETPTSDMNDPDHDVQQFVSSTISQAIGLQVHSIPPSSRLSDFGLDSLMGLAVLGKLREAEMEVESDFFLVHDTMEKVYSALTMHIKVSPVPGPGAAKKDLLLPPGCAEAINCILLQQNEARSPPRDTLFLLPDGSGSPYSYASLKTIGSNVEVYGLTCPFIKNPSAFTCGIEGIAALYCKAILSKSFGRLHLGGWSAGGVLAFEIARQLAAQHDREITSLILIDAPCPTVLPPMHNQLVEFLDSLGLFSCNGTEQKRNPSHHRRMLEHFEATTKALAAYNPAPLKSPLVALIVWANDGVLDGMSSQPSGIPDDPMSRWMLDNRHDLQAHGWDQLLPSSSIQVVKASGNHFTLVQGDNISVVSSHLQRHFSLLANTSPSVRPKTGGGQATKS